MRWLFVLGLVGCFDPRYPENVPCSLADPCPNGQQCIGGRCNGTLSNDGPTGDGPQTDANVDGPIGNGDGDTCDKARELSLADSTVQGTLAGASDDYDPPIDCGTDGIEVVYALKLENPTSVSFKVSSPNFGGQFYTFTSCPPPDFNTCGNIAASGSTAGVGYPAGTVFLVIERETGSGTDFTIEMP